MSECRMCLLPEGKFNVSLDEHGECNYCNYYKDVSKRFTDYKSLKKILVDKLSKGKYKYDALVGLSGGKDSTYVLYKLVKEYKLKVLAISYENGFLTEYAKENIKKVVKKLDVHHEFYYPNWEVHKKFYQVCFRKLGDPCLACFAAGYFLAIKICHTRKIPLFVHGRSPYQMFRNFYKGSKDFFLPIMKLNLESHDIEKTAQVYQTIHQQLKNWIDQLFEYKQDAKNVYNEFFLESTELTPAFAPEFLAFFLFEPYDEEMIKQTIEKQIGYQRPRHDSLLSHGDCKIHDAVAYLYKQIRGINILAPEVAVMLRRKEIPKSKALEILLAAKPGKKLLHESIRSLYESLDLTEDDFYTIVHKLMTNTPGKFDSR